MIWTHLTTATQPESLCNSFGTVQRHVPQPTGLSVAVPYIGLTTVSGCAQTEGRAMPHISDWASRIQDTLAEARATSHPVHNEMPRNLLTGPPRGSQHTSSGTTKVIMDLAVHHHHRHTINVHGQTTRKRRCGQSDTTRLSQHLST